MSTQQPAELKKLGFMVGSFKGDEKLLTEEGEVRFTTDIQSVWDVGARYVRQNHKSKLMGMDWEGLLLLTFDPDIERYRAWWFDNGVSVPMECVGAFEGDALVLVSKPYSLSGAPALEYRVSFRPTSEGPVVFRLEAKKGEGYTPVIEATYSRQKRD